MLKDSQSFVDALPATGSDLSITAYVSSTLSVTETIAIGMQCPGEFCSSDKLREIINICRDAKEEKVKDTLKAFVKAADEALEQNAAIKLAIETIFHIISQRSDQDRLLDFITTEMSSRNIPVLESLRKADKTSRSTELMFRFVRRTLPLASCFSLLDAENKEIAGLAKEAVVAEIKKDPKAILSSPVFNNIRGICESSNDEQLVKDILTAFRHAETEDKELLANTIFYLVSLRNERASLLRSLDMAEWSDAILTSLKNSEHPYDYKKLMFDFLMLVRPLGELEPLLNAKNEEITAWAREAFGATEQPLAGFEHLVSVFHDQEDEEGLPIRPSDTLYLRDVLEMDDSTVVQDTAAKLRVLPRDLERMTFYAYSGFWQGFDMFAEERLREMSKRPAEWLRGTVRFHLNTRDAERILEASYIIYWLRLFERRIKTKSDIPAPNSLRLKLPNRTKRILASGLLQTLLQTVDAMAGANYEILGEESLENRCSNYRRRFYNEAIRLQVSYNGIPADVNRRETL